MDRKNSLLIFLTKFVAFQGKESCDNLVTLHGMRELNNCYEIVISDLTRVSIDLICLPILHLKYCLRNCEQQLKKVEHLVLSEEDKI